MTLVKWTDLTAAQHRQVRAAFVHWRYDTTVTTFAAWAAKHAFYITKAGTLANRPNYCEPHYLA